MYNEVSEQIYVKMDNSVCESKSNIITFTFTSLEKEVTSNKFKVDGCVDRLLSRRMRVASIMNAVYIEVEKFEQECEAY